VPATAAPIAPQPIESAVSARTFVESIGVNVHLHATDTAYGNYPAVKSLLTGANLHHVRDGLIDTTWQAYYDRLNDLGSAGIHSTLITNVPQSTTLVSAYPSRVQRSLEAIEGPNEYDRSNDPQWATTLRDFVRKLYPAVRSAPAAAPLSVVGPSLTSGGAYAQLGDVSAYVDYGNMHDYFAGFAPGNGGYGGSGYGSIAYNKAAAGQSSGIKAIYATETGYSTTPNTRNAVPEAVQAIYVPRMFLEQYLNGIPRTFAYELVDEGPAPFDHLGLVRSDLSTKPAYTALAALLNLLAEPTSSAPSVLSMTISGNVQNLHHLVLHKSDGTFYIAYWLETSSFDVNAGASGAPIAVPPQSIAITFGQAVANVENYAYDAQSNLRATPLGVASNGVTLSASDRVSVLKLSGR